MLKCHDDELKLEFTLGTTPTLETQPDKVGNNNKIPRLVAPRSGRLRWDFGFFSVIFQAQNLTREYELENLSEGTLKIVIPRRLVVSKSLWHRRNHENEIGQS